DVPAGDPDAIGRHDVRACGRALAGAVRHVFVLALEYGIVGDVVVHRLVRPAELYERGPAVLVGVRVRQHVGSEGPDVGRETGQADEDERGQQSDESAADPADSTAGTRATLR